jgi:hypothetical protein
MSSASKNRATMITNMMKSGIFVSTCRDTSQSSGDTEEEEKKKKKLKCGCTEPLEYREGM